MYRTPPHKIGLLDRATFSNIEQQSIDYITGPLSTAAQSVDSALSIACLTPAEREVYKIEHNLEGLMRGDILSRYRAYAIGRQWGWLSVNKILERENENGIGPDGDEYLTPLNMVPAGEDPMKDDPKDEPGKKNVARAAWLEGDVRWASPPIVGRRSGARSRRASSMVGPAGEQLFLN